MSYTYAYPRAALSVDCVVFGLGLSAPQVLLIQRANAPFQEHWALPGGFLNLDETLAQAARRELQEETSLALNELMFLGVYDAVDRDPRERVITVAFVAKVDMQTHLPRANDDARDARWFTLDALPPLAFDHEHILAAARKQAFPESRA